jgi:hypothetical protein
MARRRLEWCTNAHLVAYCCSQRTDDVRDCTSGKHSKLVIVMHGSETSLLSLHVPFYFVQNRCCLLLASHLGNMTFDFRRGISDLECAYRCLLFLGTYDQTTVKIQIETAVQFSLQFLGIANRRLESPWLSPVDFLNTLRSFCASP